MAIGDGEARWSDGCFLHALPFLSFLALNDSTCSRRGQWDSSSTRFIEWLPLWWLPSRFVNLKIVDSGPRTGLVKFAKVVLVVKGCKIPQLALFTKRWGEPEKMGVPPSNPFIRNVA